MDESAWASLQGDIEQHDLRQRIALTSWFIKSLARRPDILEYLWNGSTAVDAVGWHWSEYRFTDRRTFPRVFTVLYIDYLHVMPTAPVFVLRAPCSWCGRDGFFASANISKADREKRGLPRRRCAACARKSGKRESHSAEQPDAE